MSQAAQKAPYARQFSPFDERVVLFMYVAATSNEENAADGLFQQPRKKGFDYTGVSQVMTWSEA
ncbi:MAG: hypothetical protein A2054_01695 [Deltaproteobacteria bacterium GWA2_55_10]|nr:MAG: hypothetical protein A2054_01695 [Deltaproteobacteria bacterium GWA2_55_10]